MFQHNIRQITFIAGGYRGDINDTSSELDQNDWDEVNLTDLHRDHITLIGALKYRIRKIVNTLHSTVRTFLFAY